MKNFKSVSNLCFIAKILEKVVTVQLNNHLEKFCHIEKIQSAYKTKHSTETAIVCVQSDISGALDRGSVCMMVLLDMSAAFDTVSHQILLEHMESDFSVTGNVLSWFRSYLSEREQCVIINGSKSKGLSLKHGIPQGSVLGPKLFSIYTSPLGKIIEKHELQYHIYTDVTQIYVTIETGVDHQVVINRIKTCVKDLKHWLAANMLQLNGEKSELIVFAPKNKIGIDG